MQQKEWGSHVQLCPVAAGAKKIPKVLKVKYDNWLLAFSHRYLPFGK